MAWEDHYEYDYDYEDEEDDEILLGSEYQIKHQTDKAALFKELRTGRVAWIPKSVFSIQVSRRITRHGYDEAVFYTVAGWFDIHWMKDQPPQAALRVQPIEGDFDGF